MLPADLFIKIGAESGINEFQIQKKIDNLKKKQEQLKAQIQNLEAAEKTQEKKRDTRRKILVGAYYFDNAIKDDNFNEIARLMDGCLTRQSDRELFDLSALESESINR